MRAPALISAAVMVLGLAQAPDPPRAPETLKSTADFATADGLIADRDALPGAALYNANCALCHSGTVANAPHVQWLEMMPPAAIVNALSKGVMVEFGRKLTPAQHLQIAEYLTRVPLRDGLPPEPKAPPCPAARPMPVAGRMPATGWGHDPSRFVPADVGGITATDLPKLRLKWAYAYPGATRARSQPAIGMGSVFVGSESGVVQAFDLQTGCSRWQFPASAEVRTGIVLGGTPEQPMVFFGDILGKAYALDARSGRLVWAQRMDQHPSATLTGTPLWNGGRLYVPVSSLEVVPAANPEYPCCTFRGKVVALDGRTGKRLWEMHPIPQPPRLLGKTSVGALRYGPSGAPVWTSPTMDTKRGLIYFGSGENYSSPADANSDAVFAVDRSTGARRWQRQTVAGDAWNVACMMADNPNCPGEKGPDFDHSSSLVLASLPDGRQLLLAGHKNGDVMALDPDAGGRLVWRTKVGRGSIQGGVHFGMALDGTTLYVPINDMNNTRNGQALDPAAARPGMHAIDVTTGRLMWSRVQPNVCGTGRPNCDPGVSAAVTAVPGAVIAGHLDGHVRGYARETGQVIWDVDTTRPVQGINGIVGRGGSMSGPGAAVGEGHVVINSGYGLYFHEPGNLLMVFAPV